MIILVWVIPQEVKLSLQLSRELTLLYKVKTLLERFKPLNHSSANKRQQKEVLK